jgi:hypothetical protein
LDAVERGDADAIRAAAAQPDLRDAMRLDLPTRLETLAAMATSGCPELAAEAFELVRQDPSLARAEVGGGQTLLHRAAAAWDHPFSALLLESGADPNAKEHGGHTPLNRAGNRFPRPSGVPDAALDAFVALYASHGANLDSIDGVKACTPLHMAARRGNTALAEALVRHGADVDARDSNGETPLRRAVNCGHPEAARALIALGADPDSRCRHGKTPREAARTAKMREALGVGL